MDTVPDVVDAKTPPFLPDDAPCRLLGCVIRRRKPTWGTQLVHRTPEGAESVQTFWLRYFGWHSLADVLAWLDSLHAPDHSFTIPGSGKDATDHSQDKPITYRLGDL